MLISCMCNKLLFIIFSWDLVLCAYRQAENAAAADQRHQSTTKESESYV